jgi:hypothetical protein
VWRIGPHCMKMMGCWPSRRIGVAVKPRTNLALVCLRMASNDAAPTWLLARQVVVDHRIRQRHQQPVAAVAALDARLLADASPPLVGASRRVARLARGLALPANWVDIGATPEQPSKQCHLLGRGQVGTWRRWRRVRHTSGQRGLRRCRRCAPHDAVRLQQRHQPQVLGLQRGECLALSHRRRARRSTHFCVVIARTLPMNS